MLSVTALLRRLRQHPVTRDALGFATLTTLTKAAAFLKEAVVASAFGVGTSMDSYLMALIVIGFPSAVLLNAAQTVFIREYVRVTELNGELIAARFLRTAAVVLMLALTVLLLAWMVLLPGIIATIGHGLGAGQRALVGANVHKLIPYYYLNGINLLGYGVLQSRRAYARAALIPIATPLIMMLLVGTMHAGLDTLIGALTFGTGAETVLILVLTSAVRARPAPRLQGGTRGLREFVWGTLTLMPGTLVTGLVPVIEQTIASGLGSGAISALGYASKLPATLNTLLTTTAGVTILPYFSQRLARDDQESCRRFFVRYTVVLLVVGVAVAAIAVIVSAPFVRLAFQRGAFSPQHALTVASLQRAYLWQLPGALVGAVAGRFAAANGRYRILTIGSLLAVPVTGLLQWGLAAAMGPRGLALGTSVGATLSAIGLFWLAWRTPRSRVALS